ncbi:MAG: glycosyltransferase family 4 protein, partial [Akkermansia sp.]|nr:glycosyltransferase family 4 protein [Akkermansia sp.]
WTGHRTDLRDVLCSCDVTLSLTLQPESFGKTTLEALALGRPVAGYEHGGVGEQLNVFLPEGRVPTKDTQAMAELLAHWYQQRPTPVLPVPAPYRREDMINAHLELYRSLCQA